MTKHFEIEGNICQNPAEALEREWIITNGLGGFASSTIIGANTRKYHGLLIAPLSPPLKRFLFLSKIEESVVSGGKTFSISTNIYPGTLFPMGYQHLVNFRLDPFPTFTFVLDDVELEKTVFLVHNKNQVVAKYKVIYSNMPIELSLSPLVAFRDFHSNTYENEVLNPEVKSDENLIWIQPYPDVPPLYFYLNTKNFQKTGFWYKNVEYPQDIKRGLQGRDDLFNPFTVSYSLKSGDTTYISASLEKLEESNLALIEKNEILRVKTIKETPTIPNADIGILGVLRVAADSFIVKRDNLKTIIAGYPWLSEWGRDAMISLSGLCISTKRFEDTREILLKIIEYFKDGLLPNRFSERKNEVYYDSIDTPLHFINAIYYYFLETHDIETIRNPFYYAMQSIINYYTKGTHYNIHETEDNLLFWDDTQAGITWMNQKIEDKVVTHRPGMNVEINALWYNALKIMAYFANELGDIEFSKIYEARAEKTREGFNKLFPIPGKNFLYDTIYKDKKDETFRVNQIFAISLPFPILYEPLWQPVFQSVTEKLLTPYGLRTLSTDDPNYHPHYEGSQNQRDLAQHQGSVYPWLIGPYIDAFLRVNKRNFATRQKGLKLLNKIFEHFNECGLGTISEIFDGAPPHRPKGCISQAWNVAEVLRAYITLIKI